MVVEKNLHRQPERRQQGCRGAVPSRPRLAQRGRGRGKVCAQHAVLEPIFLILLLTIAWRAPLAADAAPPVTAAKDMLPPHCRRSGRGRGGGSASAGDARVSSSGRKGTSPPAASAADAAASAAPHASAPTMGGGWGGAPPSCAPSIPAPRSAKKAASAAGVAVKVQKL